MNQGFYVEVSGDETFTVLQLLDAVAKMIESNSVQPCQPWGCEIWENCNGFNGVRHHRLGLKIQEVSPN